MTVVGFGEAWARDLPAVTGDHPEEGRKGGAERMKIAWRYEKLGEFGSGIGGSRGESSSKRGGGCEGVNEWVCEIYDLHSASTEYHCHAACR